MRRHRGLRRRGIGDTGWRLGSKPLRSLKDGKAWKKLRKKLERREGRPGLELYLVPHAAYRFASCCVAGRLRIRPHGLNTANTTAMSRALGETIGG